MSTTTLSLVAHCLTTTFLTLLLTTLSCHVSLAAQVGAQRSEELEAKLARLELAHSTREQQRQADNSAATNKALDPGAMLAKLEAAQEESPPPLSPEGGVKKESPLPPSAEGPASEDLQVADHVVFDLGLGPLVQQNWYVHGDCKDSDRRVGKMANASASA